MGLCPRKTVIPEVDLRSEGSPAQSTFCESSQSKRTGLKKNTLVKSTFEKSENSFGSHEVSGGGFMHELTYTIYCKCDVKSCEGGIL
jgi:hypothetical protein